MLSIICAFNNKTILKECLEKSVVSQNYNEYELIEVDSNALYFNSAAEALNYGVEQSKGDILLFCHQDIEFLSDDFLNYLNDFSNKYDFEIAGVAGIDIETKEIVSSMYHGPQKLVPGLFCYSVRELETIDECLMLIKREKFQYFRNLCNTWHMYGVEYCMRVKGKGKILLIPKPIYHVSPGYSLSTSYYDTLFKLAKQYKTEDYIRTTCGTFCNDKFIYLFCLKKKIKLRIKRFLKLNEG